MLSLQNLGCTATGGKLGGVDEAHAVSKRSRAEVYGLREARAAGDAFPCCEGAR